MPHLFQFLCQRLTIDKVHHIICSTVLLKQIMNFDDMLILQFPQTSSFFFELLTLFFKLLGITFYTNGYRTTIFISVIYALHKELFNGHIIVKDGILSHIRIAKASLPQQSLYSVFSTLQGGVRL